MIFLIDSENANETLYDKIGDLEPTDKVIIFYSGSSKRLSIKCHINIEKSSVEKEYISVLVGTPNALDFQLVSHLGYLIAIDANNKYAIISEDKGYDVVCKYWQKANVNVNRYINFNLDISANNKQENNQAKPNATVKNEQSQLQNAANIDNNNELKNALKNTNLDVNKIIATIDKYKSKQGINNALVKTFGSDKAGVAYKAIKPFLKNKT